MRTPPSSSSSSSSTSSILAGTLSGNEPSTQLRELLDEAKKIEDEFFKADPGIKKFEDLEKYEKNEIFICKQNIRYESLLESKHKRLQSYAGCFQYALDYRGDKNILNYCNEDIFRKNAIYAHYQLANYCLKKGNASTACALFLTVIRFEGVSAEIKYNALLALKENDLLDNETICELAFLEIKKLIREKINLDLSAETFSQFKNQSHDNIKFLKFLNALKDFAIVLTLSNKMKSSENKEGIAPDHPLGMIMLIEESGSEKTKKIKDEVQKIIKLLPAPVQWKLFSDALCKGKTNLAALIYQKRKPIGAPKTPGAIKDYLASEDSPVLKILTSSQTTETDIRNLFASIDPRENKEIEPKHRAVLIKLIEKAIDKMKISTANQGTIEKSLSGIKSLSGKEYEGIKLALIQALEKVTKQSSVPFSTHATKRSEVTGTELSTSSSPTPESKNRRGQI